MTTIQPTYRIRSRVPPEVNGICFLDRSSSGAFARSALFIQVCAEFGMGSLRRPTTGHDNLPRSHQKAPKHTYKFLAFSTFIKGNLWDPNYNQIGYVDEDGRQGDGRGLDGAAPISEIVGIDDYLYLADQLAERGVTLRDHEFLDWWSAFAEGIDSRGLGGTDAVLDWYRNPYPIDQFGNPIAASLGSLQDKINENCAILWQLWQHGRRNIVANMGGENWRGIEQPFPWATPDTDQNNKYTFMSDHQLLVLQPVYAFCVAQGMTSVEFCGSFLESVESGKQFPLGSAQRDRNRTHLAYDVSVNGPYLRWYSASCHYRGDEHRWLTEPQLQPDGTAGMQYSFITDSGQGNWRDMRLYVLNFTGKKFLPMANSVGDSSTSLVWTTGISYRLGDVVFETVSGLFYYCLVPHVAGTFDTDLNTNEYWSLNGENGTPDGDGEKGDYEVPEPFFSLMGMQQLIEQIDGGIEFAQFYPGIGGDHGDRINPSNGKLQHTAGYDPSVGIAGMQGDQYIKFNIFHALKTFGSVLQKRPDRVWCTGMPSDVVHCVLRTGGIYHVWLMNKKFSGTAPNEVGAAQTVTVDVSGASGLSIDLQRRFSLTENTNPVVTDAVTQVDSDTLSFALPAFGAVYAQVGVSMNRIAGSRLRLRAMGHH